ncbi:MAG: glycine zipper family protein [Candidatus Binatia bacterium]
MRKSYLFPTAVGLLLTGCVAVPTGPSVMVLPGYGKDFEQFRAEDAVCRQWALQQTGMTTAQASTDAAVSGAAVGTVVGAAAGAAVGAASGHPATGAAVGSGLGLLGGTAVGADRAAGAQWSVQRRYDIAYMQCMYAKGNQVPVPGGFQRPPTSTWQRPGAPPGMNAPVGVPPPPAGSPPPPPPGSW